DDRLALRLGLALEQVALLAQLGDRRVELGLAPPVGVDAPVQVGDLGLHRPGPRMARVDLETQALQLERVAGERELDVARAVAPQPGATESGALRTGAHPRSIVERPPVGSGLSLPCAAGPGCRSPGPALHPRGMARFPPSTRNDAGMRGTRPRGRRIPCLGALVGAVMVLCAHPAGAVAAGDPP